MKSFVFLITLIAVLLVAFPNSSFAQRQISLAPSFYTNTMFASSEYPIGVGGMLDIDYQPKKIAFFSIALRGKYAYYTFDDNSKITYDDNGSLNTYNHHPKLMYDISCPQLAIVPKLYYDVYDNFSLYFESDFSFGMMSVKSKYLMENQFQRVSFNKNVFSITPSIGGFIDLGSVDLLLSVGWNFINFNKMLEDHKPTAFKYEIDNQRPSFTFALGLNIPLF